MCAQMVRLSCFGTPRVLEDDWDVGSQASIGSDNADIEERTSALHPRRKGASLFPNKRAPNRDAVKMRLKKILANVKKDADDKERAAIEDPEFRLLAKIYSEELDITADLGLISRNRAALNHMLPFILNALLYGNREDDPNESTRSTKKSSSLKVSKRPREMSLNGASHLVKDAFDLKLESFLYEQAMHSVHLALECSWYFTASLFLGPQVCYHKTMTLLLGMESVVTNSAVPGDLFRRAGMTKSRKEMRLGSNHLPSLPAPASEQLKELQKEKDDDDENDTGGAEPTIKSATSVREVALDTTGNGEHDLKVQFSALKMSEEARLSQWLEARRERANTFHAELDFIKCLTDISNGLFDIEREFRRDVLRRELEKLNGYLPQNVFIPTERRPHRVLRIVPEQAHVFSTKERVPYLLVVEVEDLAPPPAEKDMSSDDHGKLGALRKIGSIGSAGPSSSQIGPSKENSNVDSPEQSNPNQPGDKFSFSPDVTTDGRDALAKRESSFRVETQYADDRRPPDEELLKALGEPWHVKSQRVRSASQFGSNPNWRLVSCIVKARDQLRQEMLAQRLIQEFSRIFERARLPLWLRPYQILSTSSDSGLIETVTDAKSIDSIKKHSPNVVTLQDYFVGRFGGRGSQGYKRAVKNFVQSMAGYSVVQYLLNIKDRHNGNLMVDAEGHIVHIDFGFLLSNSPGGNMEFEKAPFKLTSEMVEVMGGTKSGGWKLFRKLCVQGYVEACRNANKIMLMVDIAYPGNESMPCFLQGRGYVLENLRERFGVDLTRRERAARMARLIGYANGNWTTRAYDHFQRFSLGIAK